jgi:hypothetical protein
MELEKIFIDVSGYSVYIINNNIKYRLKSDNDLEIDVPRAAVALSQDYIEKANPKHSFSLDNHGNYLKKDNFLYKALQLYHKKRISFFRALDILVLGLSKQIALNGYKNKVSIKDINNAYSIMQRRYNHR